MAGDLFVGAGQQHAGHLVGVGDVEALVDGENAGVGVLDDGAEHLLRFQALFFGLLTLGDIPDDSQHDRLAINLDAVEADLGIEQGAVELAVPPLEPLGAARPGQLDFFEGLLPGLLAIGLNRRGKAVGHLVQ